MPVESFNGGTLFSDADGVALYRMLTIIQGMKLEIRGLRLTAKAPSAFTIARREFGLRGSKQKILADMIELYNNKRSGTI